MTRKQIDILSPIPRRHLIDSSASSLWLGGDGNSESGSPPPQDGFPPYASSQRAMSHSPSPIPESPATPISTLQSLHHQHSPTRARSPSYFRDPGLVTPTTAPAGMTKFLGQQDLGVAGTTSSLSTSHGTVPHARPTSLRVSSQSFSTLYKQEKQPHPKEREREGSVGPPSSMRSSSVISQRHSRHEIDKGKEKEKEKEGTGKVWIKWMHRRGIKAWVVPLLVLLSTLVKFAIGLGTYSGGLFVSFL